MESVLYFSIQDDLNFTGQMTTLVDNEYFELIIVLHGAQH